MPQPWPGSCHIRVVIQEDEVLQGELPIIRETGMRELLSEALKFVHLMI